MKALTEKQRQIYDYIISLSAGSRLSPLWSGRSANMWGSNPPPPSTSI